VGALGDDALSILLGQKGLGRLRFDIVSRHGSRFLSLAR
jgi:hypothetical protein